MNNRSICPRCGKRYDRVATLLLIAYCSTCRISVHLGSNGSIRNSGKRTRCRNVRVRRGVIA